jgi:hypothetical protein
MKLMKQYSHSSSQILVEYLYNYNYVTSAVLISRVTILFD